MNLNGIRKAVESRFGNPTATVSLRHKGTSAVAPTELDVLIFEEQDDEPFAYLATAGMSALPMIGQIERAELTMRIDGKLTQDKLKAVARRLGDVAIAPFLEGFGLTAEMILDDVEMPSFTGTASVMVFDWGGDGPEWLRGLDPPVRLFDVVPLFPTEVEIVREIGVVETLHRFHAEDINPNDPTREKATLGERDEDPYDPEFEVRPIEETWDDIDAWLAVNAPRVFAGFLPGAQEDRIAKFEAAVGDPLPADYRACFARHNGMTDLHDYQYMSVEAAEATWRGYNEMVDDGTFLDGRTPNDQTGRIFQPVWWHRGWLPFAADGGGNLICVDIAPGPRGVRGQVVFWEIRTGPEASHAPSIAAWLDAYAEGLKTGRYIVTDEGFIERAD